jgi:hypothetical protein
VLGSQRGDGLLELFGELVESIRVCWIDASSGVGSSARNC